MWRKIIANKFLVNIMIVSVILASYVIGSVVTYELQYRLGLLLGTFFAILVNISVGAAATFGLWTVLRRDRP